MFCDKLELHLLTDNHPNKPKTISIINIIKFCKAGKE